MPAPAASPRPSVAWRTTSGPPASTWRRSCPCTARARRRARPRAVGPPFLVSIGGRTEERASSAPPARARAAGLSSSTSILQPPGHLRRERGRLSRQRAGSPSFALAALTALPRLVPGPVRCTRTTGTRPCPRHLRTTLAGGRFAASATTVLSVHNPGYQGHFRRRRCPMSGSPVGELQLAPARVVREDEFPEGRAGSPTSSPR